MPSLQHCILVPPRRFGPPPEPSEAMQRCFWTHSLLSCGATLASLRTLLRSHKLKQVTHHASDTCIQAQFVFTNGCSNHTQGVHLNYKQLSHEDVKHLYGEFLPQTGLRDFYDVFLVLL